MQSIPLFVIGKKYLPQRNVLIAATLTIAAALLAIIQDLLHASYNGYSFYFSESLLFKSFWGLFFPISMAQVFLINRYSQSLFKKTTFINIIILPLLKSMVHILLFSLVIWGFSYLFFDHTYSFAGTLDNTITENFYQCLLIYGVITFSLIHTNSLNYVRSVSDHPYLEIISVSTGRNSMAVHTDDIVLITAASPYICLHTSKSKLLHAETLTSISGKLDNKSFVRIHKSTIVNLRKVVSYKSRLNGDYDVVLANGVTTRLSRNYASVFKKHFM